MTKYLEDVFPDKSTTAPYLKMQDLENMLTVHIDKKGNYVFDLNRGLYVSLSRDYLSYYTLKAPMHWPVISYVIYDTTRLAWLLMLVNDVKLEHAFDIIQPGESVLYPTTDALSKIISGVNSR